jgi:hypothetical protein
MLALYRRFEIVLRGILSLQDPLTLPYGFPAPAGAAFQKYRRNPRC